jgi:hypothetical protein
VVIVWNISNLLSRQQKLHLFIFSAFQIRNQLRVFLHVAKEGLFQYRNMCQLGAGVPHHG